MKTPLPDSLWAATTSELPRCPTLSGTHRTDVTVIGAGFMGMSAALALAEKNINVVLIEAAEVGWGASGRNSGLLAPGLKRDPVLVRKILGVDAGNRLLRYSGSAPDVVAGLIDRHAIECDWQRSGWIQAAHAARAVPLLQQRVHSWRELGANIRMIDPSDLYARLGTDYYVGAAFDARGGSLNPLAFVRGLAMAAQQAGATLYEQTPAIKVERENGQWQVTTPNGLLQSDALICCTNAYNRSIKKLHGTVIPLRTAQVASAPLPPALTRNILPGGESASDTQRLLTSFRLTADNRLIMGGASATAGDEHAALFAHLHHGARQRFPNLGDIQWEYGWSGYLALTSDHLPKIFSIGDNYWAGIGCNGRGIAMTTAMGATLAALVSGQSPDDCAIPMVLPRRIMGFGLRRPGVAASVVINRLLDVAERRLSSGSSRA